MDGEIREFLGVLGVTVVEVEPEGVAGECARWHEDERVARIYRHLCPGRKSKALADLLSVVGRDVSDDVQ